MNGLEPLIPVTLFLSVALVVILRGSFGKALAERIAGRTRSDPPAETAQLRAELEEVRRRLEDVEQRLDFAERLLTNQRGREALPGRGS